jgi:hypothetical protein
VTLLNYDSEGRVIEITRTTNGEHTTGPTSTFKCYALGKAPSPCSSTQKATVVTDPEGNKTTYCASHLDEVEQTKDAKGNISQATYSPFGRIASTTSEAPGSGESGNVSTFDYDESGQNLLCVITGTSSAGESSCPSSPSSASLVTSFNYKDEDNPFSATQVQNPRRTASTTATTTAIRKAAPGRPVPARRRARPAAWRTRTISSALNTN